MTVEGLDLLILEMDSRQCVAAIVKVVSEMRA